MPTTPDYNNMLDAQMQQFVKLTTAAFPDNAATLCVVEQRKLYNAMCERFYSGRPDGVSSQDDAIRVDPTHSIGIRTYQPHVTDHAMQVLYLHGGGFVVGNLESHDDVCAEISEATGCRLTSVDYRLAPEHKHPAALDDTLLAVKYLWQKYRQPIVLCGDSCGATLCAAASHALRNKRNPYARNTAPIRGQVLIYPGLGGDVTTGSYVTHANAPMLTTEDVRFYSAARCTQETDQQDPLFAPLLDTNFTELPKTIVFSAQFDPLSDDGYHYCNSITQAGGDAQWINEPGMVHGYLRARYVAQSANSSFKRILQSVESLLFDPE